MVAAANRALYVDILGGFALVPVMLGFFNQVVVMLICAGVLSSQILVSSDRFRSRTGSLKPAIFLASAMWVATACVTALELLG